MHFYADSRPIRQRFPNHHLLSSEDQSTKHNFSTSSIIIIFVYEILQKYGRNIYKNLEKIIFRRQIFQFQIIIIYARWRRFSTWILLNTHTSKCRLWGRGWGRGVGRLKYTVSVGLEHRFRIRPISDVFSSLHMHIILFVPVSGT